jgi:hypothetical protein
MRKTVLEGVEAGKAVPRIRYVVGRDGYPPRGFE